MTLCLPEALRAQIMREARAAFPAECCGLIEGLCQTGNSSAIMLHPARNLAPEPDRFEIDPKDHIAAARAARGRGHQLIGCYHSHPDGKAAPSRHDGAGQEDFIWVIAATDGEAVRLAAFVYRASCFEPVGMGADLVTSSLNERS